MSKTKQKGRKEGKSKHWEETFDKMHREHVFEQMSKHWGLSERQIEVYRQLEKGFSPTVIGIDFAAGKDTTVWGRRYSLGRKSFQEAYNHGLSKVVDAGAHANGLNASNTVFDAMQGDGYKKYVQGNWSMKPGTSFEFFFKPCPICANEHLDVEVYDVEETKDEDIKHRAFVICKCGCRFVGETCDTWNAALWTASADWNHRKG